MENKGANILLTAQFSWAAILVGRSAANGALGHAVSTMAMVRFCAKLSSDHYLLAGTGVILRADRVHSACVARSKAAPATAEVIPRAARAWNCGITVSEACIQS